MMGQNRASPSSSPMRRPSGSGSIGNASPMPERPQSVENPMTPRNSSSRPHTPSSAGGLCQNMDPMSVQLQQHPSPMDNHHYGNPESCGIGNMGSPQSHFLQNYLTTLPNDNPGNAQNPPNSNNPDYNTGNRGGPGAGAGGGGGGSNIQMLPFPVFSWFDGPHKMGLKGGNPFSVVSEHTPSTSNAVSDHTPADNPDPGLSVLSQASRNSQDVLSTASSTGSSSQDVISNDHENNSLSTEPDPFPEDSNLGDGDDIGPPEPSAIKAPLNHTSESIPIKNNNENHVSTATSTINAKYSDATVALFQDISGPSNSKPLGNAVNAIKTNTSAVETDKNNQTDEKIITEHSAVSQPSIPEVPMETQPFPPNHDSNHAPSFDPISNSTSSTSTLPLKESSTSGSNLNSLLTAELQKSTVPGNAVSTETATSTTMPLFASASMASSGESQNALLKQLLQNTGCASTAQTSENVGFSLTSCLNRPATTVAVVHTSHLSEAATRIPQPTPVLRPPRSGDSPGPQSGKGTPKMEAVEPILIPLMTAPVQREPEPDALPPRPPESPVPAATVPVNSTAAPPPPHLPSTPAFMSKPVTRTLTPPPSVTPVLITEIKEEIRPIENSFSMDVTTATSNLTFFYLCVKLSARF
jgi:hypothetical protein